MTDQSKPITEWQCMKCGHRINITERKAKTFDGAKCDECGGPLMPAGYDFRIDSASAIPLISNHYGILNDEHHGLVDFDMHWHTNNELGEIRAQWHALFLLNDPSGLRCVLFIGDGQQAKSYDVPSSIETCEEALEYIEQRHGSSHKDSLTMKLNIECGDAIKGLKAVQREARNTAVDIKELQNTMADLVKQGAVHTGITVQEIVDALKVMGHE